METATSPSQGFPRDLLAQPIATRLHYFETKVGAHQHLKEVHAILLHAIRYPAGASLLVVFGPTGVGKTTLRQRIERQLLEDAMTDPSLFPGHIPVVAMEAASPDSGSFHWKDYYTRALLALDEPFIADKITYDVRDMHRDEQGRLVIERNLTIPDLRRALEKTLLYRQPRAFIVDEAQHFRKMASGRRLLDQMDNLKSLAGMTNTVYVIYNLEQRGRLLNNWHYVYSELVSDVLFQKSRARLYIMHVLVGTYELLGLTNLSAQLSRRSLEIHFPRYHADKPEDLKEFKKLLRTLQKHLPLPEEPDLESHYDYFYEHCLGCTGMLKTWLNRTLAAALEHQASTLTRVLWERHAQPRRKLVQMIREIREGEQTLQEDEAQRQELRTLLKLAPPQASERDTGNNPLTAPHSQPIPVGQRAPHRDPVGREDEHDESHRDPL